MPKKGAGAARRAPRRFPSSRPNFKVMATPAIMDEQGVPQVTNTELIADLEAILLELRDRFSGDAGAD